MEYLDFERILSAKRMHRYKDAANGDTLGNGHKWTCAL